MKRKILYLLIVCFIMASMGLKNESNYLNDETVLITNIAYGSPIEEDEEEEKDCWWVITRGGDKLIRACQVWSGNTSYFCKWVADVDEFDVLSTCN